MKRDKQNIIYRIKFKGSKSNKVYIGSTIRPRHRKMQCQSCSKRFTIPADLSEGSQQATAVNNGVNSEKAKSSDMPILSQANRVVKSRLEGATTNG